MRKKGIDRQKKSLRYRFTASDLGQNDKDVHNDDEKTRSHWA